MNIVIDPGSGLAANPAALAAFNAAAEQWESRIANPITVTISADLTSTGFSSSNILGQTSTAEVAGDYNTIRNALAAAAAGNPNAGIVQDLPTLSQFNYTLPAGFTFSGNLATTTADAKALGFTFSSSLVDATMTFNSSFDFYYDNTSTSIGAGQTDFESVAAHEIGHALGFDSAVDNVDVDQHNGTTGSISPTLLDLYRFNGTAAPTTVSQFLSDPRYLSPGGVAITDDLTNTYPMSTGQFEGDGYQASHWLDNSLNGGLTVGIMNPTLGTGTIRNVGPADLEAMRLIGYDVVPAASASAAAPEPATPALLLVGLMALPGAAGHAMRLRRAG